METPAAATPAPSATSLAPFVQLSPTRLVFDPARLVDRTSGQLIAVTLTNTHGAQAAAFKFRTNAPNRYTVKPVMGVIAKGATATIQIKWEPNTGVPDAATPDKFLLQTCLVPLDQTATFGPDSWKSIPKEQTVMQSLPTKFLPNEAPSDLAQTPARPASGAAAGSPVTAASTRTNATVPMEPYTSISGVPSAAPAADVRAPVAAVAPSPVGAAEAAGGSRSAANDGQDQKLLQAKEAEVAKLRQRVTDLEATGDLTRRRRPSVTLTKGHLVVVSVIGFCAGLAWPWLRTLPPVITAVQNVTQLWSTYSASAWPTIYPLTKFFTREAAK